MKRYVFAGLVLVLTAVVNVPVAHADTANRAARPTTRITPFTLVSLAYQGHYRSLGIPGYSGMFADSSDGRVNAKKLVQVAVAVGDLPATTLNDRGFINAVEANLDALEIPNTL